MHPDDLNHRNFSGQTALDAFLKASEKKGFGKARMKILNLLKENIEY